MIVKHKLLKKYPLVGKKNTNYWHI